MKIAIVSQEYPPETAKGGIGTQAYAKAHGLTRLGHKVVVISRVPTAGMRTDRVDSSVRVIRLAQARGAAHTQIADWLTHSSDVAAELGAVHAASPLDLIEFPEWGCEGYVHLLNRTEWYCVPTVIHLHGPAVMLAKTLGWPEPGSEFHRVAVQMEATCLRLADAVYSSSACSADWCATEYGLDRAAIPVLHTGVDTTHFSPRTVEHDGRPTVAFAGKVTWNKGILPLLDAALGLAREIPGLRLRMLGRVDENVSAELHRRACDAGFPGLLELAGFVSRDLLPDELSRADVFAAPSRYEGGPGFVYLEAMACGVPVIGCSGSGAAEVIVPEVNGLLVDPDDVVSLAAALRRVLSDEPARVEMGRAARSYVMAHADATQRIADIESFFSDVVAKAERP